MTSATPPDDPDAVEAYFQRLPLPVRLVAADLHAAVLAAAPRARVGIKWGVPFYTLREPVCYVSAAKRHVTFGFLRGAEIRDDSGRLTGTGRSPIRKAVFRDDEDVPRALVEAWLRQAVRLDGPGAS